MKKIVQTLLLTVITSVFYTQTITIDSIPNPECVSFNLNEPGFAIGLAGRMYYGGKANSYYSADMGATWDTSAYNWSGKRNISTVAVSPINGNVYIGGEKFAMSTDSGANYTELENFECKDIYPDPYGNVFIILANAVYKYNSPDLSGGRVPVLVGGASFRINNLCAGEKGELYAVGEQKIYMSSDTGNTWVLKREITSGPTEFRHVIAAANNKILYGEIRVNLHQTDTSFVNDTIVNCYTGMNSIKTPSGFMFFPERSDRWSFSFDNGVTFSKYYGSGFNTLINGATVPRMSYEASNVNGLAVYNNKIYYAGSNCVITVLSAGTSTGNNEIEKEYSISIYPNPISNGEIMNVTGTKVGDKLLIRDITGKEMNVVKNGVNSFKIDSYASGVYFLTIYSSKEMRTIKFIVE